LTWLVLKPMSTVASQSRRGRRSEREPL